MLSLTLYDMGLFGPSAWGGRGGRPHHNFVVYILMIMEFMELEVVFTMVAKICVFTSVLWLQFQIPVNS